MGAPAATVTADSAAELLRELVALSPAARLPRLLAEGDGEAALIAMAEACDRMTATAVAAALSASEVLVRLADDLRSPRAQAETRGARALALSYAGEFSEALSVSRDAADAAESGGLVVEAARSRLASVQPLAQLGRYEEAIQVGEAAREAFLVAGELQLAAKADICLGAVSDTRDDHARALMHYDRALPLLPDDLATVAQLQSNRGVALMGLDRFTEAEAAFQSAVDALGSLGLDWAAAIAEGNLAYMATRQGRLERAMHHFERARRCLEADESPGDLARLLAEQADAMALLGLPAEAVQVYQLAIPTLESPGMAFEAAQARAGLGLALLRLGCDEDAEAALSAAAKQFEQLDQPLARARLDVTRAELTAKQARLDEARTLASDALGVLAGRPLDEALARERLARLDLEAGELSSAAEHIAVALPVAERLDLVPLRARLLHLAGRLTRERGDSGKAFVAFRKAIAQVERVRGSLQAERFRMGFLQDHVAIYNDAILAALDDDPPDVAAAFAMTEQAKSRALLDLVAGALDLVDAAERNAANPAEARLLAKLVRIRAELNWHFGVVDEGVERGLEPKAADERRRAAVQALEHEQSALEDRLSSTAGVAGLYAPPVDLTQAQRLVPAGTALIEYYAAGSELVAFVLQRGTETVVRRLTARSAIDDRVRRLHFQIGRAVAITSRGSSSDRAPRLLADVRRELGALFDMLIAPLQPDIADAGRLMVVPHGAMHAIPFNALWDGERYLIERHEVVVAPSASVLAQLAARRPCVSLQPGVVLGVPDDLAPRIGVEADMVGTVLGVSPVVGAEATVERLRDAAPNARIVHLACHGRFVAGNPMASGLKLADRWLTVRDVYGLRLDGSLVTLSDCETGRAAVSSGDELLGLIRAFYAAGASSLVLSLWVADDDSTAGTMADFYRALRSGASPAAALRAAQRAQLSQNPHPAFWAPFIIGGSA